jgi:signal transduction histidine kinase
MSSALDRLVRSEGFRVAGIFLGIFMLSSAVLAGSVLFIVAEEFRSQVLQVAQADIAAVKDGYRTGQLHEAREVIQQQMAAGGASDYFLLQQGNVRLAGNLPAMTPHIGTTTVPIPTSKKGRTALGIGTWLAPGLYAFTGSNQRYSRLAQQRIVVVLLWVLAGAAILGAWGGIFVSRSVQRRTGAIAQACRAIMAGDLATRIPLRGTSDELDRLSRTINSMLDRISALMENVRQVTNDIAHDLRTPLTHLRYRLERARQQAGTPQDYDKALEAAIAAADDIMALFTALLRIAQVEGSSRRAGFVAVDAAALLSQLREMFTPVADDAQHRLVLDAAPVTVQGDRELLVQLFSNLIENAIVHTPAGTTITLGATQDTDGVRLAVSDDGPGVPLEEHGKLFQPLYRREASRTQPGYGLGLSLVSAIAELHDAKLETGDAPGFRIALLFPGKPL